MQHVSGLDHVVVLVRDLAGAEAQLARLGFRPTPCGVHSAHMGTANTTILFGDGTYLEALGVLQPTGNNLAVRSVLAEREGPYGLAFKTDDADAAAAAFAAAGIGPGVALEFARPVELPSGPCEAAFRVARTDPEHTPGTWLFVCQHRTPEVTWRTDFLDQPNGAHGLAEVAGMAEDLEGIADAYGRIFADRLHHDGENVLIDAGSVRITFCRPAAFAERFAPLGQGLSAAAPRLAALRLRTGSLEQTQAVLSATGCAMSRRLTARSWSRRIKPAARSSNSPRPDRGVGTDVGSAPEGGVRSWSRKSSKRAHQAKTDPRWPICLLADPVWRLLGFAGGSFLTDPGYAPGRDGTGRGCDAAL